MALESTLKFNPPPLPMREMTEKGFEYYDQPVVVSRWCSKLKTTIDPLRLSYEDVTGWIEI
ncbi:MAG: hypothetical protein FD131_3511 [Rhodocyclaceae bacterium]|nr:MAG: hypothetical protein FD131_3511 [Rhodocyclaceae bacterium]